MRTYSRTLRTISVVTLAFFSWTFLSLWQIPAAIAAEKQKSAARGQSSGKSVKREQRPEEKFEGALEAIREYINKAEEKSQKGQNVTTEIAEIKEQRIEIESLDVELRKEFAATEKKLKDAKLPQEILDRHYKFLNHYEDNLRELRESLGIVEKYGVGSKQGKAALKRAKDHLERTKPPRKHVPLDPKNLPFRNRQAKAPKAPRLTKEEFEKDFGPQRTRITQRTAWNPSVLPFQKEGHECDLIVQKWSRIKHKPIMLAMNDIASDVPFSPGVDSVNSQSAIQNSQWKNPHSEFCVPDIVCTPHFAFATPSLILAQSTVNLPTVEDLAETPEVQFSQEIRAKAQELENNPVKIYNWVRNNINYQPYYGSFKGAAQTLAEGAGNDFDQASLLIALLRASNIAAKYVYGTVEIPADRASNMVGVSDPRAAATILSTLGIPVKLVISGGTVKAIQMEKAWVDAWIDYFPSRGARHKQGGEDTWIPLDPAFKQYTYKQGMDMYGLMGFNAESFLMSYITDTRDITAYQDYSMQMIHFLDANYPDASVEDVLGDSEIKATATIAEKEFPYLLGTLPFKVIIKAAEFSQVPSSKDYMITIQVDGDSFDDASGLSYAGGLNELASKRGTVSYDPASSSDEALIEQYGGNVYSVPPYLLIVKPVLRISGAVVATGSPIGMGKDQGIVISFIGADGESDRIRNIITAGGYSAIIIQSQNTPITTPSDNMAMLIDNSKQVSSPEILLDDLLGQLLYSIGLSYFETLTYENEVFAKTLQLVTMRQPSEAMVTQGVKVDYLFGFPHSLSVGGVNIDVDRNVNVVYSPTGDKERERSFMILSGLASSISENKILEAFFNVPSLSAVRLLKLASEQAVPIFIVSSENLAEVLPQLRISADVKADIINGVNAGKKVIVSKEDITYDQWTGAGYIILDPITGAGSFMIGRGLGGAETSKKTPIADPNFKLTWYDSLIFKIARWSILNCGIGLVGTLYKLGCKDPSVTGKCRDRIDCSGLTSRCYAKAGIKLLGDGSKDFPYKNAQQQYNYSVHTDDPISTDLVFFRGSYDKNCDGLKDPDDRVTHVAIYTGPDNMIGAQGKGVNYYEISSWQERYPKYCEEFVCETKNNNVCVKWDFCKCAVSWRDDTSQPKFDPFVGFGKIIP